MPDSIEEFRMRAKRLRAEAIEGNAVALSRIGCFLPEKENVSQDDAMFVLAREQGCDDWKHLENAVGSGELDRVKSRNRLRIALFYGQRWVVDKLLHEDPHLPSGDLGLQIALYQKEPVFEALSRDPAAATRKYGMRTPILHLAFSRYIQSAPDRAADMLAVAEELLRLGADPNDGISYEPGSEYKLSALYGALCHADNFDLGKFLLEGGADPNDNESLYHSTELNRLDGLELLLHHGAKPDGTNALARALDFNWHEAVELLLRHGANPNEGIVPHPSGEPSIVAAPLHQAARRMCDGKMIDLLLDAGADARSIFSGHSAYAFARIYGNEAAAKALKARGGFFELNKIEKLLADEADGNIGAGARINPIELKGEAKYLLVDLVANPSKLEHARRLVKAGFDFDAADAMGVTPVQAAGWQGLPEAMSWLMSLGPDLEHLNDYGGNLLSTVIHGSENCPERKERDHVACARLALASGVALSTRAIELAGDEAMANFLKDWARLHPEMVVEGGLG
ncbi:MAG: ankyrin repeat domain-containing protein [Albidovulum sp.]|nr:ankyrin repeat domain-containing protein [Albidovulum sp.]